MSDSTLAMLCDSCDRVNQWIDMEIENLSDMAAEPNPPLGMCQPDDYLRTIESLIVFREWLREQWVAFANRLEQTR